MLVRPARQRLVARRSTLRASVRPGAAPACRSHGRVASSATAWRMRLGVGAAHQLADVLHLAAPAFVAARRATDSRAASSSASGIVDGRPAAARAVRPARRPASCNSCDSCFSCVLLGRARAGASIVGSAVVGVVDVDGRGAGRTLGSWRVRPGRWRSAVSIAGPLRGKCCNIPPDLSPPCASNDCRCRFQRTRRRQGLRLFASDAVPADRRGRTGAGARSWVPAMPGPRCPKASACRCRCARASSRTSSATATSRSASASTWASGAATPAPPTSRAAALRADGAGGLRHRPLHRRRPGRRPARCRRPGHAGEARARPRSVPPLGHRRRGRRRTGAALRSRPRCAVDRAHHQLRRRRRVGAAGAFLGRQLARLPRRLCQLAPFAFGVADRAARPQGRMQRDAWYSSMRDADELAAPEAVGRYAAERALSRLKSRKRRDRRGAGAVRVARWPPGLLGAYVQATSGRRAVPQGQLPARQPGPAGAGRRTSTSSRTRTCCKRQGQRAVRRRRRAHAAARRWSRAAWCRATSCRAIRRASSACAPPAMPAARRT